MKFLKLFIIAICAIILTQCTSPEKPVVKEPTLTEIVGSEGPYNIYQQTFVLAMLSNMTGGFVNSNLTKEQAVSHFENNVTAAFKKTCSNPQMISNNQQWELTWGPTVFIDTADFRIKKSNITAATQTIFIAKKGKNHVLAIAGTNSHSVTDLYEDIDIVNYIAPDTVNKDSAKSIWPYRTENKWLPIKVTPGTVVALEIIRNMEFQSESIAEHLSKISVTDTITITGHSLGGGLTPPLSLALFDPETKFSDYKNLHQIPHRIYPIAAPDIGTKNFVDAVRKLFPAKRPKQNGIYSQWNQKIWNSLDIVPKAWSLRYLEKIKNMYGNNPTTPHLVDSIVNSAGNVNYAHPYATLDYYGHGEFEGIPFSNFSGCTTCTVPKSDTLNPEFCPYFTEVLHQHIPAYFNYFGIAPSVLKPPIIAPCSVAKGFKVPKKKK